MKIYNKIKLDINTGKILEEDSFEYNGPIAKAACSGVHCTNQGCNNCVGKYTAECLGNASSWTDDPVAIDVEDIKAIHVNELRAALDAEVLRRGGANCGIGGWASVTAVVDDVEAQHFTDLKTCNNGLTYYSADGDVLNLISESYAIGGLIYAADINNMRTAVKANELLCTCDSDCGSDDCFCACYLDCGACNYV